MKYSTKLAIVLMLALLSVEIFSLQNIEELNESNFAEKVLQSSDIWIVAFTAQWCGHCKRLKPQLESLAFEIESLGVKLAHVDQKQNRKLVKDYVVNQQTRMVSYPTLVAFKDGIATKIPGNARNAKTIMEWAVDHYQLASEKDKYGEDNVQGNAALQVEDDEAEEL